MTESISWDSVSDHDLARTYVTVKRDLDNARQLHQQVKDAILHRLAERDATTIRSDEHVLTVKHKSPSYNYDVLRPLLEMLPADVVGDAYTPEKERVVKEPERWSGAALNRIQRQFGGEVGEYIKRARQPSPDSYLTIDALKKEAS